MLGCLACWAFAISLIFEFFTINGNYLTSMMFAIAFIFVGTLSRAVSVYRDVHSENSVLEAANAILENNKKDK